MSAGVGVRRALVLVEPLHSLRFGGMIADCFTGLADAFAPEIRRCLRRQAAQ